MANLSTLFSSAGSSVITHPKYLPLYVLSAGQGGYYFEGGGTSDWQEAGGGSFWVYWGYGGAATSIAANDTYVTAVDQAGAGFLSAVIGPYPNGSATTTFKITLDGTVYTIDSLHSSSRLFLGPLCFTGVNPSPGSKTNGVTTAGSGKHLVADDALSLGLPVCWFSTSLKVEIKVSANRYGSDPYDKCGAMYRFVT